MVEEKPDSNRQQDTHGDTKSVTPVRGETPIIPPPQSVIIQENPSGQPAQENSSTKPTQTPSPTASPTCSSHLIESVEKPDKQPTEIEKRTLKIAYWGLFLAFATAGIFLAQLRVMSDQTQILSTQFIASVADSISADSLTQKQIAALQKQADAAQASANAISRQMRQDQRPWLQVTFDVPPALVENSPLIGAIHILNSGKTPARKVLTRVELELVSNGEQPNLTYYNVPITASEVGFITPKSTLVVNTKLLHRTADPLHSEPTLLSVDDIVNLKAGKSFLVIHAEID